MDTRPQTSPGESTALRPPSGTGAGEAAVTWLPRWAREFSDQFFAGTTCVFLLHGNVHDLTRLERDGTPAYGGVTEFLATQLFGKWDVVLQHDLSLGLKAAAGGDGDRLRRMLALLSERIGEPKSWPRDPDMILSLLDKLIQSILMEVDPSKRISLGIILDYAQYLIPSAELSPDGRRPGNAAGTAPVLGAEPVHQAA